MKQRQDAWTEENDRFLAETVLRHVRDGSTQLNAFEEVGDALNRTSAACGFRWNAVVRYHYEIALQEAKKQRKELKKNPAALTAVEVATMPLAHEETPSLETIIAALQKLSPVDNSELRQQNEKLTALVAHWKAKAEQIRDDYNDLLRIINRARQLITVGDEPLQIDEAGNVSELKTAINHDIFS